MFNPLKILIFILLCLSSTLASSQSIDGLKEIVKLQQDKISSIEDNLKKLIGSIEEQSNLNKSITNSKLIDDKINEINLTKYLQTEGIPDPDLLIRTGNTKRLSNFLLWQLAYSEIFFEKKLWPAFTEKDYIKIIKEYKNIKRNFGRI